MSIPSGALSLADSAKFQNDPLVSKITKTLYEQDNILTKLSFINRKSMKANGARWEGSLPNVDFVPLNTDPPTSTGSPNHFQESAYLVRNNIPIDSLILEDENNITDPLGSIIQAYLENWTYKINNYFIKNGTTGLGDPNAPLGLQWRIDNPNQSGVASEMKIDGGALNVGTSMSAANALTLLELFETALDYMGAKSGTGVIAIMNDYMLRRFKTACALSNQGLDQTRDNYDRTITTFRGVQLMNIGRTTGATTGTASSNNIITKTENAAGTADTGSTHTSIYFVRTGQPYFYGWQFHPMKAVREGIQDDNVIKSVLMQFPFGFMMEHPRSVARIYGLNMG